MDDFFVSHANLECTHQNRNTGIINNIMTLYHTITLPFNNDNQNILSKSRQIVRCTQRLRLL